MDMRSGVSKTAFKTPTAVSFSSSCQAPIRSDTTLRFRQLTHTRPLVSLPFLGDDSF